MIFGLNGNFLVILCYLHIVKSIVSLFRKPQEGYNYLFLILFGMELHVQPADVKVCFFYVKSVRGILDESTVLDKSTAGLLPKRRSCSTNVEKKVRFKEVVRDLMMIFFLYIYIFWVAAQTASTQKFVTPFNY